MIETRLGERMVWIAQDQIQASGSYEILKLLADERCRYSRPTANTRDQWGLPLTNCVQVSQSRPIWTQSAVIDPSLGSDVRRHHSDIIHR